MPGVISSSAGMRLLLDVHHLAEGTIVTSISFSYCEVSCAGYGS
jgi:hypothetical protein